MQDSSIAAGILFHISRAENREALKVFCSNKTFVFKTDLCLIACNGFVFDMSRKFLRNRSWAKLLIFSVGLVSNIYNY